MLKSRAQWRGAGGGEHGKKWWYGKACEEMTCRARCRGAGRRAAGGVGVCGNVRWHGTRVQAGEYHKRCDTHTGACFSGRKIYAAHEEVYGSCRAVPPRASSSPSSSFSPSVAAARVEETRAIVEGGMMAAVGGLMYFGSILLRLDAHVASLYPLPVVLMCLRWNAGAAARCVAVTTLLLCAVAGPLRGLTYFFMNGALALVLGACWRRGVPWYASICACALARSAGVCGAIATTSALMRENLAAIFVANITSVLENVHASVSPHLFTSGRSAALFDVPPGAIYACAGITIVLNSIVYCLLLHLLYAIVLKLMGRMEGNVPGRVKKWLLTKS